MNKTDDQILDDYAEYFGNIKEILQEDVMVIITNRTHRLHYFAGYRLKVDLSVIGNELTDEDNKLTAMKSGKTISYVVDLKDYFDFPFLSIDYPIRNTKGEVIGCIGIAKSLEKEQQVEEITHGLAATLEQVNISLQEVANGSQGLSNTMSTVVVSANESSNKIQEINKVITAITDISKHSNLLGLNASIEAARAGELGRGFAVVAEEMRKLASESKNSAGMVTQILLEMKNSIESIVSEIQRVGNIAENQSAATQEITAAMQEVGANSLTLVDLVKIKRTNI